MSKQNSEIEKYIASLSTRQKIEMLGCDIDLKLSQQFFDAKNIVKTQKTKELPQSIITNDINFLALGTTFNRDLIASLGKIDSYINTINDKAINLLVSLGVIRDPMHMGVRKYFSEDSRVVLELAKSYIKEVNGIVFATNILSGENSNERRSIDERTLYEYYLYPLMKLANFIDGAILPTGTLNSNLVSQNAEFLNLLYDILKSDSFIINEIGSIEDFTKAVQAGSYFSIVKDTNLIDALVVEVDSDENLKNSLDSILKRYLLFLDKVYKIENKTLDIDSTDVFKTLARESIVMLKNDCLPLESNHNINVSGDIDKKDIKELKTYFSQDKKLSSAYELIVFNNENSIKPSLQRLSEDIKQSIFSAKKQGKKVILVVISPCAIKLSSIEKSLDAFFYVPKFYDSYTYKALSDIIYNKYSPSGSLSFTWAFTKNDYPCRLISRVKDNGMYCYESLYNGYKYFSSFNKSPQYCFGHGLNYLKLEFSNLKISVVKSDINIEFHIKNSSDASGYATVFAFVDFIDIDVIGLKKQILGFDKVYIEANEQKSVKLNAKTEDFEVYDATIKAWQSPYGKIEISVGESVQDVKLVGQDKLAKSVKIKHAFNEKTAPSYFVEKVFLPLGVDIEKLLNVPLISSDIKHSKHYNKHSNNKYEEIIKQINKNLKRKKIKTDLDFSNLSEHSLEYILNALQSD